MKSCLGDVRNTTFPIYLFDPFEFCTTSMLYLSKCSNNLVNECIKIFSRKSKNLGMSYDDDVELPNSGLFHFVPFVLKKLNSLLFTF